MTIINRRHLIVASSAVAILGLAATADVSAQDAATLRSETVERDRLDIHYEVHGDLSGDETPFLLLHGGMGSIDGDFAELLPALAVIAPVIGVEQQGHGRTGDRDGPITLDSMRDDTLAVLDALDVERVHAVGFSMGGMLALELGVRAPERLASLTALSASQNKEGMRPEILAMNEDPSQPPSPEAQALMPTEEDFAAMQAGFAANPNGPAQFEATFEKLSAFITSDWGWSDAELAAVDVPALLVLGDTDFSPVGHVAGMAETMPDAELAVLPGTTHLTITRRADWLVPMIANRIESGETP